MKSAEGSVCSYLSTTSGVMGVTRAGSWAMPALAVMSSPRAIEAERVRIFFMARKPTCRAVGAQATGYNAHVQHPGDADEIPHAWQDAECVRDLNWLHADDRQRRQHQLWQRQPD